MNMPRKTGFGPTQKDIGIALNVAQSTVAAALNPKLASRLAPETAKLIQEKAAEMGYRPQRMARILSKGCSYTIGVVYRTGFYHAQQTHVRLLAQHTFKRGYQLMPLDLDWFTFEGHKPVSDGEFRIAEDYLLGAAVEGVIFCNLSLGNNWDRAMAEFCKGRGMPLVSIGGDRLCEEEATANMKEAFLQLTLHHIEQGAKNLVLQMPFYTPEQIDTSSKKVSVSLQARMDGFSEAIHQAGGSLIERDHPSPYFSLPKRAKKKGGIVGEISNPVWPTGVSSVFELGKHLLAERLAKGAGGLPDSFVCSNDQLAAGVIAECLNRNVCVPSDMMISGADDSPFASLCSVPLTTVAQPSQSLAEWGVNRLVELIEFPAQREQPKKAMFPCEVLIRESTLRKR